jgi:glycosyltransferase involved in cell wall biosynthesis
MKILIISSADFYSNYGGGQVYVKNIVNQMVVQNIDVCIATPGISMGETPSYKGKKVYTFTDKMLHGNLRVLKKFITNINPTIVHVHGFKEPFSLACNALGITCVVTAHHGGLVCPAGALLNYKDKICNVSASDSNCLPCVLKNTKGGMLSLPFQKVLPFKFRLILGKWLKKLPFIYFITPIGTTTLSIQNKRTEWQQIYINADLLIAPSIAIKEAMIRNGAPLNKIKVIPHGVPLIRINKRVSPKNKQDVQSIKKSFTFFYVGRICHEKGIHIMLKAFNSITLPAELHIIGGTGNSKEESYAKKLQRAYKDNNNIIWHGKVPPEEVNEKISLYDVMIHPTICLEIFGLTIAESLLMKKPVIATNCGGAEMQITHGENGLLVAPNNTEELTNAMQKVIDTPALLNHLKINAGNNVNYITEHVNDLQNEYCILLNNKN